MSAGISAALLEAAFFYPNAENNKRKENMKTAAIAVLLCAAAIAQADDRDRDHRERNHNYIIERQEAYQVEGVPTSRIIVGRREIDVYRNGMMFEGNHLVGVRDNDDAAY